MIALIRLVLGSTYFFFDGKCYEQTYGVATGSRTAQEVASFFIEHGESGVGIPTQQIVFHCVIHPTMLSLPQTTKLRTVR
jgi:hypothetical protein